MSGRWQWQVHSWKLAGKQQVMGKNDCDRMGAVMIWCTGSKNLFSIKGADVATRGNLANRTVVGWSQYEGRQQQNPKLFKREAVWDSQEQEGVASITHSKQGNSPVSTASRWSLFFLLLLYIFACFNLYSFSHSSCLFLLFVSFLHCPLSSSLTPRGTVLRITQILH